MSLVGEDATMTSNNNPYDTIGVAIVAELFKQAETISPISDEPTSKPSLLKRLVNGLRNNNRVSEENGYHLQGDDCTSPKPI
jgi:hypothetical protein